MDFDKDIQQKPVIKIMKYRLNKPLDAEWTDFGILLNNLQETAHLLKNKIIQLAWEYEGFCADYYEKNHERFSADQLKEVTNYKTFDGYIYHCLKDRHDAIASANLTATIHAVWNTWQETKKEINNGERSIPSFKKNCPMDLDGGNISVLKQDNLYCLKLKLINKRCQKELQRKDCNYLIQILVCDNRQRMILDYILNEKYKVVTSQLIREKGKSGHDCWSINLAYRFIPTQETALDPNKVMGIYLGVTTTAFAAFHDDPGTLYGPSSRCIDGNEVTEFLQELEARRQRLRSQCKFSGKGRNGHGRNTKMKPVNQIRERIDRFRDTCNHKYARFLVELAHKNHCGFIQMEELSQWNSRKQDKFLQSWTYFDLQKKIADKAKVYGILVTKIAPQDIRHRCSVCGYIDRGSRSQPAGQEKAPYQKNARFTQVKFKCPQCGKEFHADYNAARNMATPGIAQIISEYTGSHHFNFQEAD